MSMCSVELWQKNFVSFTDANMPYIHLVCCPDMCEICTPSRGPMKAVLLSDSKRSPVDTSFDLSVTSVVIRAIC